jgi:hypothetical protein
MEPRAGVRHLTLRMRTPWSDVEMQRSQPTPRPSELTLLDLTGAVIEVSADDREVVATLAHLIRSGRVRIGGR